MAGIGVKHIRIVTEVSPGRVAIRLSSRERIDPSAFGDGRFDLYSRTLGWLGGGFECRQQDGNAEFIIRLPALESVRIALSQDRAEVRRSSSIILRAFNQSLAEFGQRQVDTNLLTIKRKSRSLRPWTLAKIEKLTLWYWRCRENLMPRQQKCLRIKSSE